MFRCRGLFLLVTFASPLALAGAPDGWTTFAPHDEIAPAFSYDPVGGPRKDGSFVIESGAQEGEQGRWTKTFVVDGGKYYRFSVLRKMTGVESARRYGVARVLWQDTDGKRVHHAEPTTLSYAGGSTVAAEPEYPMEGVSQAEGWTEVSGVYFGASQSFPCNGRTRVSVGPSGPARMVIDILDGGGGTETAQRALGDRPFCTARREDPLRPTDGVCASHRRSRQATSRSGCSPRSIDLRFRSQVR